MNEQEARAAIFNTYAGCGRGAPGFLDDALDAYRDAVLAAQPCYWQYDTPEDDRDPDCTETPSIGICPTCQARARMKARELTTV